MQFPNISFKMKNDRYTKSRDGANKLLYISCAKCNSAILVYQKDGRGQLLRCYADRILWPAELVVQQQIISADTIKNYTPLHCPECQNIIGIPMIYAPEHRAAYRIVPGTIKTSRAMN
jgi:DNA-directed RNA polymerase subunit RPC12/RpoP